MSTVPISTFPPPMTLSALERAVLEALPAEARQRFEIEAGRLEFVEGKSLSDAEAEAFGLLSIEFAQALATPEPEGKL